MTDDAITRRAFLRRCVSGAAGAALACSAGRVAGARGERSGRSDRRPNIILIMADDLGYECIGANGGTSYRTPQLDKLAAGGMRFEHCYCTPLCSPTRVLLLTGRYGFRNYRGWGVLDPAERTFGHVLREAGYATCISGKWQFCEFDKPENADHPKRSGFDRSCVWVWHYKKGKPSRYWDPVIWQDGKLLAGTKGKFGPDIHCDYVLDFIERNRDRPFFAYYSTNLVHAPFVPTPDSRPAAAEAGGKEPKGKARAKSGKGKSRANYKAMVEYMDKCIGRVVAKLGELGLRERTLILFTGDNGTPRGIRSKLGERTIDGGKGRMADAGTHVPLIANWPARVPAGRTTDALVDFSDVMPTLAELARAKLPEGVKIDGRSFVGQLLGTKGPGRQWAYIHHGGASAGGKLRAARTQRWKLYGDGRLFDVQADPDENRPVDPAGQSPEAAAARRQLAAALASLK